MIEGKSEVISVNEFLRPSTNMCPYAHIHMPQHSLPDHRCTVPHLGLIALFGVSCASGGRRVVVGLSSG